MDLMHIRETASCAHQKRGPMVPEGAKQCLRWYSGCTRPRCPIWHYADIVTYIRIFVSTVARHTRVAIAYCLSQTHETPLTTYR
jgi:hypothetical protein